LGPWTDRPATQWTPRLVDCLHPVTSRYYNSTALYTTIEWVTVLLVQWYKLQEHQHNVYKPSLFTS